MNDRELLSKIGLSANEAEIYLALLRGGPLSAYGIAQKTGIYRPHVYDKLETLIQKGLISYVQQGKRKVFSAAPPSKVLDYLNEQEEELKGSIALYSSRLGALNALYHLPKEDTKVGVFTGVEGLKLRLNDIWQSEDREVLLFGLDDAMYNEALPAFMPQYFKRLRQKGLRERVITPRKRGVFMFDNDVTTYRFLDTGQMNPTNTMIYGNKVVLVIWGTPVTTIVIENVQLARTYREHFEYLWRIAEKRI